MAITDEIPADVLTVLLPVGIGVVFVILTVAVVFWLGSNRQRSFEEAKAQASRQAEEVLREKEHRNSPRAAPKKGAGRRQRRPKKGDQGGDESQEDTPLIKEEGQSPPRSILKVPASVSVPSGVVPAKEATPERSPRSKVVFHLDTPPKDDGKGSRVSPPTPHPSKQQPPVFTQPQVQRTVQPLFEEPEEEEVASATATSTMVGGVKTKKPHPQTAVPASGGKSGTKKPKARAKQQPTSFDGVDALPASRISDIVTVSSLSDEDIQQLLDVLLEKMNTNAEWQAASMRPENVKTLKKQNQDLQNKFEEAQKTVLAHSNKIKELRAEIQNEKMRHQSMENNLNGKITSQSNELAIARAKMSGLEEELKQTKAQSSAELMEKLQEENAFLQKSLAASETVASSQKSALESQAKQMKELDDTNSTLKADLQKARSNRSNEPQLKEKVAELEGCVDNLSQQNLQLQSALEQMSREKAALQGEAQNLGPLREERDKLKQKASALETDNVNLRSELDKVRENSDLSLQANNKAIRVELERKNTEEVARVHQELSSQHQAEVEQLRGTISHLEGSHGDKEKELNELRAQVEKCSDLETQLKAVSEQLQQEQGSKKELQVELESLRSSASSGTGNGPVGLPDKEGPGAEELAKVEGERDELKKQVKELEKKLEDLKIKNNTLRDNCWKAKDEAAATEKACEEKLKAARIDTEKRCKSIKTEAVQVAREEQQRFLKQLFPSIKVNESEPSKWMDEFEVKVEELLEGYKDQISSLQSELEDLQESKQSTSREEAEQIRTTLETTRSILEKLQSEVVKQTMFAKEKDVVIEKEKVANRTLQEQLKKERDTSARLQQQLNEAESATSDGGDVESRLSEVEERLKETERERDGYKDEVGNLHSSLGREVEAKDRAQQQAEQWEKQLQQLNERVASEEEQRQTSEKKCQQLEGELNDLRKKLLEKEQMVEIMKNSNRELNATIGSLSPTHKSNSRAESEV